MNITQEGELSILMQLLEDIEVLQDNKPDARKKREYKAWKEELERKMKEYNKLSGFKGFINKIE